MAHTDHQETAAGIVARCAIVTLSDTRTEATDTSGKRIRELLTGAGHTVVRYEILPDDPARLSPLLDQLLTDGGNEKGEDGARENGGVGGVDVILTNGGTGIARRDQTISVIEQKLTAPLPGFGELFRMLSWEQIGPAAMLSRAAGGIAGAHAPKLLFAMPGSTKAVELAMTRLILPELKHLLYELRK